MDSYVLDFREIDRTHVAVAGGKGAHLGELMRIEGVHVPPGFCVTTDAFRRMVEDAPSFSDRLDRLSCLEPEDREGLRVVSAEIRRALEATGMPHEVDAAITSALAGLGTQAAYAVRSSATAEDLPTASFAGQQDSYLHVSGVTEILRHVSRCWASLFTERAVTYRVRNGVDHRKVHMAVVVQQMVVSQAAGVLFTADPVTSNRKVVSVEATFGLAEALVAGATNADVYKVRDGEVVTTAIAAKQRAVQASPAGGTREQPVEPVRHEQPALIDAQVVELAQLGRRIEAHFGCPQDIEWCLVDDGFEIVQSRPITTLFPIPKVDDGANHVYVSVGHQQMMTDAMKPLGLSVWQLTTPRPMAEAGGRLFVDVTGGLASPATRAGLLEVLGRSDPMIRDALQTVLDRGDFLPTRPDDGPGQPILGAGADPIETDPAIADDLVARNEASIADLQRDIRTKSGSALFDFILADVEELRRFLFDSQSLQVIVAAMDAASWLNDHLHEWLGETNAADALTRSAPHNVTSEMGLALLDVADAIRPHHQVVAFLQDVDDDGFLAELPALEGGQEAADAIRGYLDRYGTRCVGEIDITRPRWSEQPSVLVPLILGNIKNFDAGAAERRFEQGRQEATRKEQELLQRLRELPDGAQRAEETKRMIDRVRTFIGYREYPKYGMVRRYFEYKQALLAEADRLLQAGVLRERDDIFFLTFDELHDVARTPQVDDHLIRDRKETYESYQPLKPPRVLTSDGEALSGSYRRDDLPAGALVGLPASAGTVEGRARVVLDMSDGDVEPGDILITAHTDPSWSPLFVVVTGLVTEVGGLMTHGAVVAREYGLPAVVGVENATQLIPDGERIRLNGSEGYVEILVAT